MLFYVALFCFLTVTGSVAVSLSEIYFNYVARPVAEVVEETFTGRETVTVMLIGSDDRQKRGRSDTLMIANINLVEPHVELMSVPRDLLVGFPDGKWRKVNAAYNIGGPLQTKQVVEAHLNGMGSGARIEVDYMVHVGFGGFVKLIDLVGGVEIDVEKKMDYIDRAGQLDIQLEPGPQRLNGIQALGYVRYRRSNTGPSDSDFDRIKRQQKFLKALARQKLSLWDAGKLFSLVNIARQHLRTDLSIGQIIALARVLKRIDLTQGTVDSKNFSAYTVPTMSRWYGKQAVELADRDKLIPLLRRFAAAGRGVKHLKIEILNGTGRNGFAAEWREKLIGLGYDVIGAGNASHSAYGASVIVNHAGINQSRLKDLQQRLKAEMRPGGEQLDEDAQLTLILGNDLIEVALDEPPTTGDLVNPDG